MLRYYVAFFQKFSRGHMSCDDSNLVANRMSAYVSLCFRQVLVLISNVNIYKPHSINLWGS